MIGDARRNSGRPAKPAPSVVGQTEQHAQALVIGIEVVDRARQIHRVVPGGCLLDERTTATNQGRDARAKGGIQALDESGVDRTTALGDLQQSVDLSLSAFSCPERCSAHRPATGVSGLVWLSPSREGCLGS